jgi:hypothetical protein
LIWRKEIYRMGSTFQRLEILLIGLVLLIAGAVVVVLVVVRPPTPAVYIQTTPMPLATSSAAPPTRPASVPIEATPTAVTPAAGVLDVPSAATVVATPSWSALLAVLPFLRAAWPWGLLAAGISGSALLLRRMRRRRMTYTHQSVGQLLAAADHATRATNVRVMRDLAERGVLTEELAAAAGIRLPQTRAHQKLKRILPRLPRLAVPRIQLPQLRMPAIRLPNPHIRSRLLRPMLRIRQRIQTRGPQAAPAPGPQLSQESHSGEDAVLHAASDRAVPPALLAAQATDAPHTDPTLAAAVPGSSHSERWTAEERALVTAAALDSIWTAQPLRSRVLALDTERAHGSGQVVVTIDMHPAEEEQLAQLPDLLAAQHPQWRAAWRRQRLVITGDLHLAGPAVGGPLIVPLLTHGRGGRMLRFCSLTSWQHLGIYGGSALRALHGILASLLFNQPPAQLALAIIDHNEITPLYRDVAHLVALPGTAEETLALLGEAIRRGAWSQVRPLVLVVVEPDALLLDQLMGIVARQRASRTAPLHLLLVQECLVSTGREIYALLPALITSGGRGSAALLPGQNPWPSGGAARLVSRDMRLEGSVLSLDESAIAAHVAQLGGERAGLPPVLWDTLVLTYGGATAISMGQDADHRTDAQRGGADPIETVAPDQGADTPIPAGSDLIGCRESQATNELMANPASDDLAAAVNVRESPAAPSGALAIPESVHPMTLSGLAMSAVSSVATGDAASKTLPPHAPDARPSRAALLRATRDAGQAAAQSRSLLRPLLSAPVMGEPPVGGESNTAPVSTVEPENGWPIGPAPLGRLAMADLMTRMVQTPAIISGQANELGVTKNRLVDLLKGTHKAQARELAEILMAWFDLAGLLVAATKPGRLRHPRALATTDLSAIAARLSATPCPDSATVQALWAESQEAST